MRPSFRHLAVIACAAAFAGTAHAEVAGGVIGCDAPGGKQEGGALIGAVLGGLAGNSISKHSTTGTIVGAGAGAAAGSYVGCRMQKADASPGSTKSAPSRVAADDDRYEERDRPAYARESRGYERESRGYERDYASEQRHVPPGLAKKPYGMPPGQAKKYYGVGQQLPPAYIRDARYTVSEPGRYRLRYPGAGYRWVIVDGDAYLVRSKTGVVRDVVRAILS
jgi:Ni/Co efflux regulator RcnB